MVSFGRWVVEGLKGLIVQIRGRGVLDRQGLMEKLNWKNDDNNRRKLLTRERMID